MLNAGTPLWSLPPTLENGVWKSPLPVLPAAVTSAHTVFRGVTVRANERETASVATQNSGRMLVRVMGPVAFRESLVQSAGHDYMVGESQAAEAPPADMIAGAAVPAGQIYLIPARTTGGGGGGSDALVWL